MMNLYIVSLKGNKYLLNIDLNNTILNVKNELSKKIDIIPERLKLIYCGQLLEDNKIIKEYHVEKETFIHLVIIDEREYWNEKMKVLMDENTVLKANVEELKNDKDDNKVIPTTATRTTPVILHVVQPNGLVRCGGSVFLRWNRRWVIQHKMKVHLRHTQDWSYGIRYNILHNTSHTSEGSGSPGVIEGLFPKEKIPYIKKISIINIKNTLTERHGLSRRPGNIIPGGNSRSANLDLNGNLWIETPYGHRYGAIVTWNSYIDIVILFEDKK